MPDETEPKGRGVAATATAEPAAPKIVDWGAEFVRLMGVADRALERAEKASKEVYESVPRDLRRVHLALKQYAMGAEAELLAEDDAEDGTD